MKISAGQLAPHKQQEKRPEHFDQTTEAKELQLLQEGTPHSMAARLLSLSALSPQPGQTRTSQLHVELAIKRKTEQEALQCPNKKPEEQSAHQFTARQQTQFSAFMAQPKSVSPKRQTTQSASRDAADCSQEKAEESISQIRRQIQMQYRYLEKLRATVQQQEKQILSQTEELGKLRESVEQQAKVNTQLQNKFFKEQLRVKATQVEGQKPQVNTKDLDDKFILMRSEYSIYQKQLSQQFKENAELKSNLDKAKRTEEVLKRDIQKLKDKMQQYRKERQEGSTVRPERELVKLVAEGELEECINQALVQLADAKEIL